MPVCLVPRYFRFLPQCSNGDVEPNGFGCMFMAITLCGTVCVCILSLIEMTCVKMRLVFTDDTEKTHTKCQLRSEFRIDMRVTSEWKRKSASKTIHSSFNVQKIKNSTISPRLSINMCIENSQTNRKETNTQSKILTIDHWTFVLGISMHSLYRLVIASQWFSVYSFSNWFSFSHSLVVFISLSIACSRFDECFCHISAGSYTCFDKSLALSLAQSVFAFHKITTNKC